MTLFGVLWQFLDVAVVGGGESASGSLQTACELIVGGPLSVLGYTLLRWFVIGPATMLAIGVGVWLLVGDGGMGLTVAALFRAVLIAGAVSLGGVVTFAYHVSYYLRRQGLPVPDR